jgi:hypothetical protein
MTTDRIEQRTACSRAKSATHPHCSSGRHVEGGVVRDNTPRAGVAERDSLEVFGWHAGKAEVWIDLEAEAALVRGLSEQHTGRVR